jgi:hypothetical protein
LIASDLDGAAVRSRIDAAVHSVVIEKRCDRQTALRHLRDTRPGLFEDGSMFSASLGQRTNTDDRDERTLASVSVIFLSPGPPVTGGAQAGIFVSLGLPTTTTAAGDGRRP